LTGTHRTGSGRSSGRVGLVTGAARGIGRAICERLAADGAAVAVNYLSEKREVEAQSVASIIRDAGGRAIAVRGDVSDAEQVARMVHVVSSELGPATILVNNAAITRVHGPWTEIDEHEWDKVMAANSKSCFLCSRAVYPAMLEAGWGRIVNISSVTFLMGRADLTHYVASKGAMIGFTRSLARAVGTYGITVNSVSPGAIRTEMEVETTRDRPPEISSDQLSRLQAVPRRGTPEDVASAVSFLVSEEASFISGQLINVDGGLVMH
jgi:3-oxoacyl-[acyl-carrier protein] reductase